MNHERKTDLYKEGDRIEFLFGSYHLACLVTSASPLCRTAQEKKDAVEILTCNKKHELAHALAVNKSVQFIACRHSIIQEEITIFLTPLTLLEHFLVCLAPDDPTKEDVAEANRIIDQVRRKRKI